jgi:hypothetical protein
MFRASIDPSSGKKITIVKTSGEPDTFRFESIQEMRATLSSRHDQLDVDAVIEELAYFGSAEFSV